MPSLTTRELTSAALFTALVAGGALVSIPIGSVPFTLQVLCVLLAGMLLGPRLAALSVLAYLALGLVAPVYARGRTSLARFVGAGLLGVAPIYALGAVWLAAQLHLGLGTALATGVAPFVWLDVLKAVAAGLAARSLVDLPLGLPAAQRGR